MNDALLVSVVIPTLRRPTIVLRAVQSVLRQTYALFEIIVMIDGPDSSTSTTLAAVHDARLRVVELQENVGAAEARNKGVALAQGKWIAFLDDDDEWVPEKLAIQVDAAERLGGARVLLASRYLDKGVSFDRVLPYRTPRGGEPISEILFSRKGVLSRTARPQTSTYFASTELARAVPFRAVSRSQEDLDWLMRAAALTDRPFLLLPQPLSIYHNQQTTGREGAAGDFDIFWRYVHANRQLFTPDAFTFYLAICCAPEVMASSKPWQRWTEVYRGMKTGKMTLRALGFAAIYAAFPMPLRQKVRHLFSSYS